MAASPAPFSRALADPCAVCKSVALPHSCPIALTQPATVAFTYTDAGPVTYAYPCAFSRALRDA